MRMLVAGLMVLFVASMASADVDIQYRLPVSDGRVEAVWDTPPQIESTEGFGIVTLTGHAASEIVWPVPSGCGAGRQEWSRVANPDGVTVAGAGLALRPGLIFFSTTSPLLTGCHVTPTWASLRALVRGALIATVPDNAVVEALNYHWGWYYARCDDAPLNQNCIDWKANLTTMLTMYPGRGQGISESAKGATLVNDAINFKAAQCKATPGGPFC